MKKLRQGQKVRFSAIDDFTGQKVEEIGKLSRLEAKSPKALVSRFEKRHLSKLAA